MSSVVLGGEKSTSNGANSQTAAVTERRNQCHLPQLSDDCGRGGGGKKRVIQGRGGDGRWCGTWPVTMAMSPMSTRRT